MDYNLEMKTKKPRQAKPKPRLEREVADEFDELANIPPFTFYSNPCGGVRTASGGFMHFGVGRPGGSDRIGYESIVITPEMVGLRVAVFAVVELKRPKGGVLSPEQLEFLQRTADDGGIAIVTSNPQEAFDELRMAIKERIKDAKLAQRLD